MGTYDWTKDAEMALEDRTRALYLWSHMSGSGKSTFVIDFAGRHGLRFMGITLDTSIEANTLVGYEKYKGDQKGMEWHDGFLTKAWRASHDPDNHTICLVNEVNNCSDDVRERFQSSFDSAGTAIETLPSGEVVTCGSHITFVCTSNDGPETLHDPLLKRFTSIIEADSVAPAAIARLSPAFQAVAFNNIMKGGSRAFSIRQWYEVDRRVTTLGRDLETVCRQVFGRERGPEMAADIVTAQAK